MRGNLENAFADVCGDTFCGGDYNPIRPLTLTCSVKLSDGTLGSCLWTFAGAYDFSRPSDFGALMDGFLGGLTEGSVVMCHPGFVDETLISLDPLTTQREREYAFLAGEHFPPLLAANNITLS